MVNSQEIEEEIYSNQDDPQEPDSELFNQVLLKHDLDEDSDSEQSQHSRLDEDQLFSDDPR